MIFSFPELIKKAKQPASAFLGGSAVLAVAGAASAAGDSAALAAAEAAAAEPAVVGKNFPLFFKEGLGEIFIFVIEYNKRLKTINNKINSPYPSFIKEEKREKFMKIAINGFGRIGRPTLRRILEKHPKIEIAAINDLANAATLAHLLKYDSLYGHYGKDVKVNGNNLVVGNQSIKILAEKDPAILPWKDLGIDVVLECTGLFTKHADAKKHIDAGAKKVILSAPSDSPEIPTYLLGVNADKYQGENIISMGSCTTNCLAPVVKIINDALGIKKGFMTTVHSYTNDQRILDLPHKDLRRARAAAQNIIPTTTGAAKTVAKCIPEIEGKLDGLAMRVPTATVSLTDFVCETSKPSDVKEVNKLFIDAAADKLKGILAVTDEPLVSMDFKGDSHSSIVDLPLTMVKDNLVKIISWYDNEWGYACRLAEMSEYIAKK